MEPEVPRIPSAAKRLSMQSQRVKDTKPEVELRRGLHALGLRYRIHQQIVPGTNRRVDIVFSKPRIAVDVRGCFWHVCPEHATQPKANAEWWRNKLNSNVRRDDDKFERFNKAEWKLIVVWEHEEPEAAAIRIYNLIIASSQESRYASLHDHNSPTFQTM
jgi:DNA mismatch endonuclease (patch repair protein)